MRNFKQIEQGRLHDFVLHTLVGMIAGERGLAHSIKEICIKSGRIVNLVGMTDQLGLLNALIRKIGAHPQRPDIAAVP